MGNGNSKLHRSEVTTFWTNIMDEHARFVVHLLDPDEFELIDENKRSLFSLPQRKYGRYRVSNDS